MRMVKWLFTDWGLGTFFSPPLGHDGAATARPARPSKTYNEDISTQIDSHTDKHLQRLKSRRQKRATNPVKHCVEAVAFSTCFITCFVQIYDGIDMASSHRFAEQRGRRAVPKVPDRAD